MSQNNTIFEIPIYRLSPEKFREETKRLRDKYITPLDPIGFENSSEAEQKDMLDLWSLSFAQNVDHCWVYNEVVGFIRIYAGWNHIKGEYWLIEGKRIRRNRKRRKFTYRDKAFELFLHHSPIDSGKIREKLIKKLEKLRVSIPSLKRRYIDLDAFKSISPHIDWVEIIKSRERDS